MVTLRPDIRPDKSLSFEFNLDSEARIRTIRELEWVEPSAEVVKAKLIFSYEHLPINAYRKSECKLLLELDNVRMDFQTGSFSFRDDEYENPWPINLFFFHVTSSEFILRGTYRPQLELRYWGGDIVFFDCSFKHSVILNDEWITKFRNFRLKMPDDFPFDFG